MTKEGTINQIVGCANAMIAAIEADKEFYAVGSKRKKDGTASWEMAAHFFCNLTDEKCSLSGSEMRNLYKEVGAILFI